MSLHTHIIPLMNLRRSAVAASLALLCCCSAAVADDTAAAGSVAPLICGLPAVRHLDSEAVDRYAVTVAPGAAVTVNVSDTSGTIGLVKLRTSAADETCTGTLELTQPGTNIVEVSDCLDGDAGDYTITMSVVSQDASNCGLPLPCGATLRLLTFAVAGQVDAHTFQGTAGDHVTITAMDVSGTIGFVRLRVFDPDGVLVTAADSCRSSSKVLTLEKTGMYTALATACGSPTSGQYGVALQSTACPIGPDITYMGIARADSTVLPPATYDENGRPVYDVSGASGFFVVVEGRPGSANQALGLQGFMYDPNDPSVLPDMQVLVSRPLGNGSTVVCDKTQPDAGGVPGISPLLYSGTQAVADAINDFGCRVNDGRGQPVGVSSAIEACTRFPDGMDHFVDSTTTAQFCTPIAQPWSFTRGTTVVRARLRDVQGNLGAEREILVRVGVGEQATLVKDIATGVRSSNPSHLVQDQGKLYFAADDALNGVELRVSNGTPTGTMLVSDIRPGATGSLPDQLTFVNRQLFFAADDGVNGTELWVSDGAGNTHLAADINPGPASSSPSFLTQLGPRFFFAADDGVNGTELWGSSPSRAGVWVIVRDINPGPIGSAPHELISMNDTLFFAADDGGSGSELWRSDGSTAGTELLADIHPGNAGSLPAQLTNVAGTLYFTADDGTHGSELWKSNGTASGTVLVRDIQNGAAGSNPSHLTAINRALYFTADDGVSGEELWRSDGTESGTALVADIHPGAPGSAPANLTVVDGVLYFTAGDGAHGIELWKSDGTEAGTVLVKDINPDLASSSPANLTAANGSLVFTADDGFSGVEPWKSDGTVKGTVRIQDIAPGALSSRPASFTVVGSTIFFAADDNVAGRELWRLPLSSLTTISCDGDCNNNALVTIDELVTGMNILLGTQSLAACSSFDVNGDDAVTVDEIVGAMVNALNGCPES